MAGINLPPPSPQQFLQPGDGNKVNWNWHDWFFRFQAKAADVNTTPNTLVMPPQYGVTGNNTPTITVTWNNQAINTVLAGPASGSPGQPTFRALTSADLPSSIVGSQPANTFYAAPNGSAGVPSFRRIAPQDYEWGMVKKSVDTAETMTIPSGYQLTAHVSFTVSGVSALVGELWIEQTTIDGIGGLIFTSSDDSGLLVLL